MQHRQFIAICPCIVLGAVLVGCGPDTATSATDTTGSSTTNEPSPTDATASTGGELPTTGTTTDPGATGPTTGESATDGSTTGAPPDTAAARIFYTVGDDTRSAAAALRFVDIVGGVATEPATVLAAPPGEAFGPDLLSAGRWLPILDKEMARWWLVDTVTATAQEVVLPGPVDVITVPRFADDLTMLTFAAGVGFEAVELYRCALDDGGACEPEVISPPLPPTATGVTGRAAISGDNTWVLYFGEFEGAAGRQVMLGELAVPGTAIVVATTPDASATLGEVVFTPDGQTVYFAIDASGEVRYFGVDLGADPPGPAVPLHPPPLNTDARGRLAADGGGLLWWTPGALPLRGDLSLIALAGTESGAPMLLNTTGPGHAYRPGFAWTSDDERAIFLADHETAESRELYLVAADGSPPSPVGVNPPLAAGVSIFDPAFAPDPAKLLYSACTTEGAACELFLARIDQPGAATRLSAPLPPGGAIDRGGYAWSDDGSRLVYRGEQEAAGRSELFFVDLTGDAPTPPVKLHAPLPAGGQVGLAHDFSSDGQHVFFVADREVDEPALYWVELGPDAQVSAPSELSAPGELVKDALVLPPPA